MDGPQTAADRLLPPFSLAPVCAPRDRGKLLTAAILASALGFIDASVVAIALPAMRDGLQASLVGAQWIGAGYLLAMSALVLTGGAMGDRFGVARVFAGGIAIFVLASVVCALAPTAGTMIAARVVQGIGAGFMVPGSMALIARAYPAEVRGRALGLWAAAASATTALGPILGGLLLTWGPEGAWRAIFALNLPFGGLALWLLWRFGLPDPGRPGTPVDITGAALATLALGLIAWGLTVLSLPITAAGACLFAAFLWHQARSPGAMLPLTLFRDRAFAAANLATLFLFFALPAVLFYLPMTAVTAWGAREIEVTLVLLPIGLLIGLLSTPAGRLADRIGPGPLVATGAGLVALGDLGLALFSAEAGIFTHVLPAMVLIGLGMGLVAAPLTAGVMAAAGEAQQGVASGINNAVARVANLIAVAAMGSVAAWAYRGAGGLDSFAAQGRTDPGHLAATAQGFATVALIASAAAATAAVIAALGMRRRLR